MMLRMRRIIQQDPALAKILVHLFVQNWKNNAEQNRDENRNVTEMIIIGNRTIEGRISHWFGPAFNRPARPGRYRSTRQCQSCYAEI